MRNSIGLLLILIVGFTSCEGRKTSKSALTESIKEFKISNTIISEKYIPKTYIEVSVDTILSNGFRVITKTFTNMKSNVIRTVKKDSITKNELHRDIESLVTVEFKNQIIFEKTITKDFIINSSNNLNVKLNTFILEGTWVNQDITSSENTVNIDIQYCSISNNECENFNLIINKFGDFNLHSIKENTY